jgi:hypothetical protein
MLPMALAAVRRLCERALTLMPSRAPRSTNHYLRDPVAQSSWGPLVVLGAPIPGRLTESATLTVSAAYISPSQTAGAQVA